MNDAFWPKWTLELCTDAIHGRLRLGRDGELTALGDQLLKPDLHDDYVTDEG